MVVFHQLSMCCLLRDPVHSGPAILSEAFLHFFPLFSRFALFFPLFWRFILFLPISSFLGECACGGLHNLFFMTQHLSLDHSSQCLFYLFIFKRFNGFVERGEGRGKEEHGCEHEIPIGCLPRVSHWGWSLRSGHVPPTGNWLGNISMHRRCPTNWARAPQFLLLTSVSELKLSTNL